MKPRILIQMLKVGNNNHPTLNSLKQPIRNGVKWANKHRLQKVLSLNAR
eukprot:UN06717